MISKRERKLMQEAMYAASEYDSVDEWLKDGSGQIPTLESVINNSAGVDSRVREFKRELHEYKSLCSQLQEELKEAGRL